MKINSTNLFKNFTFEYLDCVSDIYENYKTHYNKQSLFHRKTKVKIDKSTIDNLNTTFDMIFTFGICNEKLNYNDWFNLIKNYAEFIIDAEKCFMYHNDDSSNVYSVIDKDNKNISLHIKDDELNTEYIISFKDTIIDLPGTKTFNIVDYINNGIVPEPETVLVIKLEVIRNFGRNLKDTFEFIYKSKASFDDDTDTIVFDTSIIRISKFVLNSFLHITNKCIPTICSIENLELKEVLNNNVRIWR